jgi:hypothetical protein
MIHLGKVVDIHPEHNSVDVIITTDGRRLPGIPVTSWSMTGETGVVDLTVPDLTTSRSEPAKWFSLNTEKRDILAVVAFADDTPVCLGFVCPPACQLNFPKEIGEELRIDRHASDWYQTINRDGDVELHHPSGTFIRVAEDLDHVDLTAKDYDKLWKLKRNLQRRPGFRFRVANTDGVQVTLDMTPEKVTLTATVPVTITAPAIDLNGQVRINGVLQVGE